MRELRPSLLSWSKEMTYKQELEIAIAEATEKMLKATNPQEHREWAKHLVMLKTKGRYASPKELANANS